ncbi:hypothetical protein GGR56DRAFT_682502 [Xylariaceae sp. FL0804]|nr:hypothetical protein GGR56DRAFT_682502 [Xylariaceae sp. FL0804]
MKRAIELLPAEHLLRELLLEIWVTGGWCDQKLPCCSYCEKRRLECSLASSEAERSASPATLPPPSRPQPAPRDFAFTDFALFHHFIKSTAVDHADDDATAAVWSGPVADMATRHPYLLHQVLALAALHRRAACPEQAEALGRTAAEHQLRAIPLFRDALAAMTDEEDDVLPLFTCACLIVPYHFAAARDPLALLLNEEEGEGQGAPPQWLLLIEGTTLITNRHGPRIVRSALRPLLGSLIPLALDDVDEDSAGDRALRRLRREIPAVVAAAAATLPPGGRGDEYARVIDVLRFMYTLSARAETVLDRKNAALRFPPFLGPEIKGDLARRRPAALVVMAFWFVLLHRVEDRWWLRGKIVPVVAKIEELLAPEHRHLIAYPLEQVGLREK